MSDGKENPPKPSNPEHESLRQCPVDQLFSIDTDREPQDINDYRLSPRAEDK